jgi:hypothetical protein
MKNIYSKTYLPFFALLLLFLLSLSDNAQAQEFIYRIPVTAEGVYRISYDELGYRYSQGEGIDPRQINPLQIHIYNRDKDVARFVYGEEDGKFDAGDYIEFYAVPVLPTDTEYKYTDENVYWLKLNTTPPVRMITWDNSGNGTMETSFLHTIHFEKN